MVTKADFTAEEWKLVLGSPMLASLAVTLADPSGLWGTMKEGMASGLALLAAKNEAGANTLAKAIAGDMETSEGRAAAREGLKAELTGKSPAEMKQQVLAALTQVGEIVSAKDAADAPGFKAWLQQVAQKTAEAANEGGFLGFGGIQISEAEKATLAEVGAALGTAQA
jgi:ATPase subunit of ABC transporter with duplicated ATPase domains